MLSSFSKIKSFNFPVYLGFLSKTCWNFYYGLLNYSTVKLPSLGFGEKVGNGICVFDLINALDYSMSLV